jgi:hypothetical protein
MEYGHQEFTKPTVVVTVPRAWVIPVSFIRGERPAPLSIWKRNLGQVSERLKKREKTPTVIKGRRTTAPSATAVLVCSPLSFIVGPGSISVIGIPICTVRILSVSRINMRSRGVSATWWRTRTRATQRRRVSRSRPGSHLQNKLREKRRRESG